MKCQEILEKLSEYIDKEVDPSLCDEIERHIEDCEPCVAFINTLRRTVELFGGVKHVTPEIPPDVSDKLNAFLKEKIIRNP